MEPPERVTAARIDPVLLVNRMPPLLHVDYLCVLHGKKRAAGIRGTASARSSLGPLVRALLLYTAGFTGLSWRESMPGRPHETVGIEFVSMNMKFAPGTR